MFVLIGVLCISVNDLLIKQLSWAYPLHQSVFLRSGIGIILSFVILHFEGGLTLLRSRHRSQSRPLPKHRFSRGRPRVSVTPFTPCL